MTPSSERGLRTILVAISTSLAFAASATERDSASSRSRFLPPFSSAMNAKSSFSQRYTVERSTPPAAAASPVAALA
jgi:hypothetical protein